MINFLRSSNSLILVKVSVYYCLKNKFLVNWHLGILHSDNKQQNGPHNKSLSFKLVGQPSLCKGIV